MSDEKTGCVIIGVIWYRARAVQGIDNNSNIVFWHLFQGTLCYEIHQEPIQSPKNREKGTPLLRLDWLTMGWITLSLRLVQWSPDMTDLRHYWIVRMWLVYRAGLLVCVSCQAEKLLQNTPYSGPDYGVHRVDAIREAKIQISANHSIFDRWHPKLSVSAKNATHLRDITCERIFTPIISTATNVPAHECIT